MSTSLDGIWDDPVENTIAQASRSTESLFLPDPDDNNTIGSAHATAPKTPTRTSPSRAASARADIDALFADLDDLEDDGELRALAPALDLDALKRQADARNAQSMGSSQGPPSSMPGRHRIMPSSSPPRDMGDAGTTAKGKDKDSAGEKKPIKRAPPLNEARLLSEDGFPALIKNLKGFKVKGKGHEEADLARLLKVYHFWAHKLYPKTQFRDTVDRVEKVCHSKRMNVALSVWRDEAKGLINGRPPAQGSDNEDEDEEGGDTIIATRDRLRLGGAESDSAESAHAPTLPPPSSEPEDDDDFDIDAIIRAEEERQRQQQAGTQPLSSASASSRAPEEQDDFDLDEIIRAEEARLAALQSASGASAKSGPSAASLSRAPDIDDEDEEMWAALDAPPSAPVQAPRTSGAQPSSAPKIMAAAAAADDDDEEMWDVMDEIERDNDAKRKAAATTTVAEPPPPPAPPATAAPPPSEDDTLDDMYM